MSFITSSTNLSLDGTFLNATCLKDDGKTTVDSSLDLSNGIAISIRNGEFDVKGGDKTLGDGTRNLSLDSNTGILTASVCTNTTDNYFVNRTFELNLYVSNDDGTLVFNQP